MLDQSLEITLSKVKLLQLKSGLVEFYIVHIDEESSLLDFHFLNDDIQDLPLKEYNIEDLEIDIVFINNDSRPSDVTLNMFKDVKVIISYTKNLAIQSKKLLHYSAIPNLIDYFLKIKESLISIHLKRSKSYADLFLRKVTAVIDEHLDDQSLNIRTMGKLMFMSRSSFSKKIKRCSGLKPTEFINHYKLEKSKHLLLVTNWQICKIADALGFCSQQYYCRLFKKQEGINPSQYRFEHQKTSTQIDSMV